MPPKRKSTVDAGQLRRTGRSKRIAVDNASSSTSAQSGPSLDAFACLNRDVVNLILHYLSLPDLVRCEGVCKSWRDILHWWVAAFGFRVHFPHITGELQQNSNAAIWEAFKVQAHHDGIRSGKVASVQEFNFGDYYHMAVMGNFVAGQARDKLFLLWHELAGPGGAVVNTKTVSLKKIWRVHVVLAYFEMNREGILLLRLGDSQTGKTRARSVVYSPIEGKTVWQQDHRHYDPRYGVPGDLTPILIGKSVLHCARRGSNRETFDLVGIDFRASEPTVIYESSAIGPQLWPLNRTCRGLFHMGERELLVLCDSEIWVGTGRVSILNGENGQLLFRFDGGPAHFFNRQMLVSPTINQFAIQSVPQIGRLGDALQPWEAHAKAVRDFIIVHTFSAAFSGSDSSPIDIVRLSADVILSPCHSLRIAIQPLAKAAVMLQYDDNTHVSDRILSYSLVETKETPLIQMAEAVLKASCPPDSAPPKLRHCFVLEEPGTKLSRRPSLSQAGLPAPAVDGRMRAIQGFVDGGRLLLEAPEGQVLMGF